MAGAMMLLTTPILLCSAPGPPLNSKDRAGTTFATSSTLLFQTDSENHTTARRNTILIDGQTLCNCQKNITTFNSTLNTSYSDQWPEKVANSSCDYNGSINNLGHFSQVKMPKRTSEELEKEPKDALAIDFSTEPHFSSVKHRQPGMFRKQNAPLTLAETTDNTTTSYLENHMQISTSKQKESLAESSLSLGQTISSVSLDDDLFLTFTCKGRCGRKISFPCSCSAICVIYGTCCDNMAHDCPHVWEKGLIRFDLIRTSDFICDQNSIYTIISCPKKKKEIVHRNEMKQETSNKQMTMDETENLQNRNRFLSNLDTTEQTQHVVGDNTTSVIESEKTRKDSITSRLLEALSAAPVTDSDTGLTFINKTVYNCNKIFCAYCSEGRHKEYRLLLSNSVPLTSSPFQVLMTLTEDAFSLKKVKHGFEVFRVPWSQAKCPIHAPSSENVEKSDHDSQIQCSVTCADPNFTLRSDGMCKAPHGALLGIADDGLAPLCPEAMAGLAQFIECGLKQEIETLRNADFSAPSVTVVFDSSLNRSLYLVRLHFDLPRPSRMIFSYEEGDTTKNLYSVALLAKSFHHYRKSQKICPLREEDEKNADLKVYASTSLNKLDRTLNIPHVMEELRGRIVNYQYKTTVCITQTVYCNRECSKNLNPNQLLCMDDPVHERDSAWISRFHSSSCFYHLDKLKTKAKNRATTLRQDSESLLQYVLSLSFLAVPMLLLF
ncbi:hypothetical protein PoB_000100700 [Plakobranchus ocellatus]|uniref:SMB domain-containing protein n=1 Tax=Plakobranchus ocellatus TaxID=259542 RepID=A0AAV3XWI6_9GAST|nr:hypothetical protein PoB_000100700 [Plakobranchus ocellatus]